MSKEILTFGDTEIEKNKFYRHKSSVPLKNVDIEKVLVSNKISLVKNNINTMVNCIMIKRISKSYDGQTKWMEFFD